MRRFDQLSEDEKREKILRLAQKALAGYGLTGDLAFAAQGQSAVLKLRAGGASYAVRICSAGRDHAPLQRELTWLAALGRDTSLSIPEPTLTLTGDLFRSVSMEGVPGTRACMVLRWIDGERREAELSEDEASAMGQFAGTLHKHAEAFRWPEELMPPHVDPASRALAAAEPLRDALVSADDRALLCDAVAFVADATAKPGEGAVGAVHGELRLRRLRHDRGSVGAFGFDDCRIGSYLDDLSVLWDELAAREASPSLHRALLDGYRSARDLPGDPEDVLRAYIALRAVESAARTAEAVRAQRLVPKGMLPQDAATLRRALCGALRCVQAGGASDAPETEPRS